MQWGLICARSAQGTECSAKPKVKLQGTECLRIVWSNALLSQPGCIPALPWKNPTAPGFQGAGSGCFGIVAEPERQPRGTQMSLLGDAGAGEKHTHLCSHSRPGPSSQVRIGGNGPR